MPSIFISYRRNDAADAAGRLYQNLIAVVGEKNVFKDVNSIPGGAPFAEVIADYISRTDFVIVLIGEDWADITNDSGKRRLVCDDDLVRKEVVHALASSAKIIPLLTADATLPDESRLPDDLKNLIKLNAMRLRRDPDFKVDFQRLLKAMGIRQWRAPKLLLIGACTILALLSIGYFFREIPVLIQPNITLEEPGDPISSTEVNTATIQGIPIVPYDPNFLGGGHIVPLPKPIDQTKDDAFEDGKPIDYLHYSLIMNEQRSLATYVAINFDREKHLTVKRMNIDWIVDQRLPLAMQREQSLYKKNSWDRGHLVPLHTVTWEDAAVSDPELYQRGVSFFSATVPQHMNLNRTSWNYLEQHIQKHLAPEAKKLVIFAGPVFRENDAIYRSTRIPRSFWQVAVTVDSQNTNLLKVYAFVANQYQVDESNGDPIVDKNNSPIPIDRISKSDFAPENYAVSLSQLSALVGLDFGYLKQYDIHSRP